MNDKARGPGENGAIQRAELFAKVQSLEICVDALIKAGTLLIQTDTKLGERIHIVNKRLRKLEEAK